MQEKNELSQAFLEDSRIKDQNEESFIAKKLRIFDSKSPNISIQELSNLYFSLPQYLHRKMEVNEENNLKKLNLPPISMSMVKKGLQTSLSASQRNCILGLHPFLSKRYKKLDPLHEITARNKIQPLTPELIDLLKERANKIKTCQSTLQIEYSFETQRRKIKAIITSASINFVRKENFVITSDVTKIILPFTYLKYFCTSKRIYIPQLINDTLRYEFLERPLNEEEDISLNPSFKITCHSSKKYSSKDYAFDVHSLNIQFSILFEYPTITIFEFENSKSYTDKLLFEDILNIFNLGINDKENLAKTLLTENRINNYLNIPTHNEIKEKSFSENYLMAFMNENHYSFYFLREKITIVMNPFKIIANKNNEADNLIYRPNMKQFKNLLAITPIENLPTLVLKKMLSKDKTKFLHMDVSRLEPLLKFNLSSLDTINENSDYNFENQNDIQEMNIDHDKFKIKFVHPTINVIDKKKNNEFTCDWKASILISKNNYKNYIQELLLTLKKADKENEVVKTTHIAENINRNINDLVEKSSEHHHSNEAYGGHHHRIHDENEDHVAKYFFNEIFRFFGHCFRKLLRL